MPFDLLERMHDLNPDELNPRILCGSGGRQQDP